MRFDADTHTAWDFTVTIDGKDIPTLGPKQTPEKAVVRNRTPEERKRAGKSGAIVRSWRWLFGERRTFEEIEEAAETDHVRGLCLAFTPASHHHLVRALSGGDLFALFCAYQGVQAAWGQAIGDAAERAVQGGRGATPATPRTAEGEAERLGLPRGVKLMGPLSDISGRPPADIEDLRVEGAEAR